jgi:hypothetical protein
MTQAHNRAAVDRGLRRIGEASDTAESKSSAGSWESRPTGRHAG